MNCITKHSVVPAPCNLDEASTAVHEPVSGLCISQPGASGGTHIVFVKVVYRAALHNRLPGVCTFVFHGGKSVGRPSYVGNIKILMQEADQGCDALNGGGRQRRVWERPYLTT